MVNKLFRNNDLKSIIQLYSKNNLLNIKSIIKYLIKEYKTIKDKDYLLYNDEPYKILFENNE